ncbi:uncharacterized protein LOC107829777 isoform X2 [Nicotiana tabacum]|uniref:uncharacterized protein LOC107829777 isoform X2 n=1 Tax=Nicotiana tabacum TaxID=4097 RepID=UPI003F4EEE76
MASPNPNPKRIPILDSFPNALVRHRRGRGGRLRSLGSVRGGSSSSITPSSSFSTISRGSITKKSSSKGKELSEPLQEPLVEEIVPNDLSFENDRKSLRDQVVNLEKADIFPSLITEPLISMVRKDCNWRSDLCIVIPNPNQRISSFRIGFSFVYTYPFTLGFNPAIDPVILDFCHFFKICLGQIGPLVWRAVACLRYLSVKSNVSFTLPHLIHLYYPKLFRHGVFTLTARSKRVLVSPKDDKNRGWYTRYVAVRTVDLVGETNIPFPEKWNFAPTMGDVEPVPNFRGWVDSILKVVPIEARTWKSISNLHGWKVKTHGFAIRGMTTEVAIALRASSGTSLSLERTQATLSKRKVVEEDSENDEDEDTSLIARPRVRRRIIFEDEAEVTPVRASLTEPVRIPSDDETTLRDTNESIQCLFVSGFESGELGPVLDEVPFSSSVPPLVSSASLPILFVPAPLSISVPLPVSSSLPVSSPSTPVIFTSSTAPPSIAPPPSVQHAGEGSSSRSLAMRSVTLEVPANNSLLRKSGGADAWLRPLIGDIEKKKMSSHSCLTLVNDIVHSTLKN